MKNIFTLATAIILIAFSSSIAISQVAPIIEWQNSIGGSLGDNLYSIAQTTDGGCILGGYSSSGISGDKTEASQGGVDFWVVKLNYSGEIEWENTIGGILSDNCWSIKQTTDGGYILGGWSWGGISGDKTEASQGAVDYWVVKLNSSGTIEWQNSIGGSSNDYLFSIVQATDGGYILGGYSASGISGDKSEASQDASDFWVVKLNSSGEIEWENTIGGIGLDYCFSIGQTTDGGCILSGLSDSGISGDKTEASQGLTDYWVLKLNSSGAIEWQNTIGGSSVDRPECIMQTTDGGYIIGGESLSGISGDKTEASQGDLDYWVLKLNNSGEIQWQNTIGGGSNDNLYSIAQTSDGGYILGGNSSSGIYGDKTEGLWGNYDYWVIKLNSSGEITWQKDLGGSDYDGLYSVVQTTDGGYILGGYSNSGISGDKTEASQGMSDYWVIKLAPDCNSKEVCANGTDDNCDGQIDEGCISECTLPISLYVTDVTTNSAKLNWSIIAGADAYKVRYKIANTSSWKDKITSNTHKKLSNLESGTKYVWQIKTYCNIDPNVTSEWSEKQYFTTNSFRFGDDASQESSMQLFPNPASDLTTIQFTLPLASHASVKVYDVSGREIIMLFNDDLQAGEISLPLNTKDFSKGVYLVKLITDSGIVNQKLIVQ